MTNFQKQIRFFPSVVCLLALSLSAQAYFAPANCAPLKRQGQKQLSAISTKRFEHLRKASDPWSVLQDPQVKAGIHAIMGNKDEEYWDHTQLLDDSNSRGDDLLISGNVRGLAGSMVSLFYLDYSTGKLLAGYIDDSEIHLFGVKNKSDVPQVINEYAKKAQVGKDIVFDVADRRPLKKADAKTKAAPLNLARLTGTYERKDGRFIYSTLLVEQLPGSQIKFQIDASNGGNSGQAAGTINLIEQRGTYKQDDGEIELKFSGGKVMVTGNDSYFCGNAVTLLGTYVKTSDGAARLDND